jgi:hypothetical protein
MEDFAKDLEIDRYYLDDICETHASIFQRWAEKHAEAQQVRDNVKSQTALEKADASDMLHRERASLDLSIRADPKRFNLEKLTENSIESTILIHPAYISVQQKVMEAKKQAEEKLANAEYEVEILRVARDALEHRKTMIENLVKLYVAGFWAKPKQPRQVIEAKLEKSTIEAGKSAQESIRRRRGMAIEHRGDSQ